MTGLNADQIVERIANANGVDCAEMRHRMEQALQNVVADKTQPHSFMLEALFPDSELTTDELIVALEKELYDAMMPTFPSWQWDGEGYKNTSI